MYVVFSVFAMSLIIGLAQCVVCSVASQGGNETAEAHTNIGQAQDLCYTCNLCVSKT